ncbi:hypothetical protein C7G83_13895 [Siccibacter turicensis]|uniref:Uncharacterized protein n=1 Tax=Siccibacter turicensis TaxID=357233 RepID=A0A2P8VIG9_9ENTR|nr:hypothetical protein C7G83_13895 [Siccibacter turicensis]
MYTPESIHFPYFPCFYARMTGDISSGSEGRKPRQNAPGGELYGLRFKAQGSRRIFLRSAAQNSGRDREIFQYMAGILLHRTNDRLHLSLPDPPVDKSGRICEKQKISGSLYVMIPGPDRCRTQAASEKPPVK